MVFLSADQINELVESGALSIDPFDSNLLKGASYTLRLGNTFCLWKNEEEPIELWTKNSASNYLTPVFQADNYVLKPGTFLLGSTLEKIGFPENHIGILYTISHLARFGITVCHSSAWINPGFGKHEPTALTLEIHSVNPSPIRIKTGIPVCHLIIAKVSENENILPIVRKSVYEGIKSPSLPRLYEEYKNLLFQND